MSHEHYSFSLKYRRVPLDVFGVITWVDGHPVFEADCIETGTGIENLYWLLDEVALTDINSAGTQQYLKDAAESTRISAAGIGRSCHA